MIIMTWWELFYYFCDYIEERDSLMTRKRHSSSLIS